MTPSPRARYFANHARRQRFPWSVYHEPIRRRIAAVLREHGPRPRVLVVGCGLEPCIDGGPDEACYHACDIDPDAIAECRRLFPAMASRLGVCPGPYELPADATLAGPFDVVVAKEVVEHVSEPDRFVRELGARVARSGELLLTTPNYGRWSSLPWLEATVLEAVAWLDGYSRAEIHVTRLDRRKLGALSPGPDFAPALIEAPWHLWALVGRWRRRP